MTPVRRPLTGLLILFLGALGMDRLALEGGRTIGTTAYLLALGFVAAPLMVGAARRMRVVTIGFMAAASAIVAATAGGVTADPYRSLVEITFVTLAAALSHRLAQALADLDEAVDSVVFGENPALALDGRQAANEILGEMARSRRHGRPLSVTVLAPDPTSVEAAVEHSAEEVQRAIRARYVHGRIARTIAEQLRRSDLLFEDPATGNFVVVSPETASEGSALLLDRITHAVGGDHIRLAGGRATFPDHALTFEQLIEHAQARLDDPAVNGTPAARKGAA